MTRKAECISELASKLSEEGHVNQSINLFFRVKYKKRNFEELLRVANIVKKGGAF